jgi:hypothetical protein
MGSSTKDDQRFLRFHWEAGNAHRWIPFTKGGGYKKWVGLEHYAVDWSPDGVRVKESVLERYPYLKGNYGWLIKHEDWHRKPGLTYSLMAQGSLAMRRMNCAIFGHASHAVFPLETVTRESLATILSSRVASFLLRIVTQDIKFESGYLAELPLPNVRPRFLHDIGSICFALKESLVSVDLNEAMFCPGSFLGRSGRSAFGTDRRLATILLCIEGFLQKEPCLIYTALAGTISQPSLRKQAHRQDGFR